MQRNAGITNSDHISSEGCETLKRSKYYKRLKNCWNTLKTNSYQGFVTASLSPQENRNNDTGLWNQRWAQSQ